jgi:hypothetical protein
MGPSFRSRSASRRRAPHRARTRVKTADQSARERGRPRRADDPPRCQARRGSEPTNSAPSRHTHSATDHRSASIRVGTLSVVCGPRPQKELPEHSDQPANSAVRRFGRKSFTTRRYWLGGMSTAGRLGAAPSQTEPRRYDLAVTALGALPARRASSVSRASVAALTREQVSRSAWRETRNSPDARLSVVFARFPNERFRGAVLDAGLDALQRPVVDRLLRRDAQPAQGREGGNAVVMLVAA